ncbi:MAG: hypothetical protein WC379_10635 [Methanoregula sp.]|jgi:hypothetical protein
MNLRLYITTRNAFFIIPVVFFWIAWSFVLGLCVIFLPYDYKIRVLPVASVAGFLFPCLISFCGSAILLYSFFEKKLYGICIFPLTLISAFGTIFCLISIFLTGTLYEWPLVPVSGMLLKLCLLLSTPAITLLLLPFVHEMERPQNLSFTCLLILSFILAIPVIGIFMNDIFPLFDPELIWSKFWDFTFADMWIEILFELYILFIMPVTGLLSIVTISDYLKKRASASNGGS